MPNGSAGRDEERHICAVRSVRCQAWVVAELQYECAFCAGTIMSTSSGWLRLTVDRDDSDERQEFFAHRGCLVGKLRKGFPLGEAFEIG
jgi:hypothetical protein